MLEYEGLTAKKMPDSFNMRATQICIVPTYLETNQNIKSQEIIYKYNVLVSIKNCDKFYDSVTNILVG